MAKLMLEKPVWVLQLSGRDAVLLCVQHEQGGCPTVNRPQRLTVDDERPVPQRWQELFAQATAHTRGQPLVIVLPDEHVYYHHLTLPAIDDEQTFARMIDAQAQVALPLPLAQLAWGWCASAADLEQNSRSVLLVATRQELISALVEAPSLVAALPAGLALAQGFLTLPDSDSSASNVIVRLGRQTTSVLRIDRGQPHWCSVIDIGTETSAKGNGDAATSSPAPHLLAAWSQQIDRVVTRQPTEAALPDSPPRVFFLTPAVERAPFERALAQTFGRDLPSLESSQYTHLPADLPLDQTLIAIGSVSLATTPACANVNLCSAAGSARYKEKKTRRIAPAWVVALAWLGLAVVGLFFIEQWRGRSLETALDQLNESAAVGGGVQRRLQVGRYLEQRAMPPFFVISQLSQIAPPGIILSDWNYDSTGQLRFSGQAASAGEVDDLLAKLVESKLLTEVQLRRASVENNKWMFQLQATVEPVFRGYAFASLAASVTAEQQQAQSPGSPPPAAAADAPPSQPPSLDVMSPASPAPSPPPLPDDSPPSPDAITPPPPSAPPVQLQPIDNTGSPAPRASRPGPSRRPGRETH